MDTISLQRNPGKDGPEFKRIADEILRRCRTIAGFSEADDSITRTFLSKPMRDCHRAVSKWMSEQDMLVSVDAAGNIRGLLGSGDRPRLLMGSHLDTVPCAGAYDGILGVCLALGITEALDKTALPFDIEVLGFSEEEGVRFRTPFLGSFALVGRLDAHYLALQDANGRSVREAIREYGLDPATVAEAAMAPQSFAFLEFHIEQGPVLDRVGESLAVVSAIAGQSRLRCCFEGMANHAGTTPMDARRDALGGTAEWILSVEKFARTVDGLVATIGTVDVQPGATNIIPGRVYASLDVRHADDTVRGAAVQSLCHAAERIAQERSLSFHFDHLVDQRAVPMDQRLVRMMETAMESIGQMPRRMVSGAGHDAMILAEKVPSVMLFLRSIGGISHHPDESVYVEDIEKAVRVGVKFLSALATGDCD